MSKEQEKFDDIERYLLDKSADKESFQQRMAENEELTEEVDLHREVFDGVRNAAIREKIKDIHLKHTESKIAKSDGKFPLWTVGIAASVALLAIVFAGYKLLFTTVYDHDSLYSQYFSPYPDAVSVRGGDNEQIGEAMRLYSSGLYQEAIISMSEVPVEARQYADIRFYQALSLLETHQTGKAIDLLEQLYQIDKYRFFPQVKWYLALAYLKNDQPQICTKYLETIQTDDFKYQEARQLIDILNR